MNEQTNEAIRRDVAAFLETWDRQEWMQEHGDWASADWEGEREQYEEAVSSLRDDLEQVCAAVGSLPKADRAGSGAAAVVREAVNELLARLDSVELAAEALDNQVRQNEHDYIVGGTLDPDCVAGTAERLPVAERWQGWDCYEGWGAYRHETHLYVNWWRDAMGNRTERNLWVLVSADYFTDED